LDDTQSVFPTEANGSDDSDAEMPYETVPRKLPSEWRTSERTEVRALPIKLADGKIKDTGVKVVLDEAEDEFESDVSDKGEERVETTVEDVSTGARFGRLAVVDVLQTKSRKQRVEIAKEQIANICQEILADPENSVSIDDFFDMSISLIIVFT
jgi:nucleolar complex protein 3